MGVEPEESVLLGSAICRAFFLGMWELDELQTCAKNFKKPIALEYRFLVGRKRKEASIRLRFAKEELFHLIGIHKLKDLAISTGSTAKSFLPMVMDGTITLKDLQKSSFYSSAKLQERLYITQNIEPILDNPHMMFKYITERNRWSKIDADYLITCEDQSHSTKINLFLAQKKESCCCESCLLSDGYYSTRPKYTILLKEKTCLLTGENKLLHKHSTYNLVHNGQNSSTAKRTTAHKPVTALPFRLHSPALHRMPVHYGMKPKAGIVVVIDHAAGL